MMLPSEARPPGGSRRRDPDAHAAAADHADPGCEDDEDEDDRARSHAGLQRLGGAETVEQAAEHAGDSAADHPGTAELEKQGP